MALCRLVSRLKSKQIANHFPRSSFTVPFASSLNHGSNPTNICPLEEIRKLPTDFLYHVRFFSASAQAKKLKDEDARLLNEEIRVPYVRLVTDEEHFVLTRNEALDRAKQLELDLVLVDRDSDPPVVKIMDYHKERYKKDQAGKERAKSKRAETTMRSDMKEIRFTSKIEGKDLKFKAETAVRMMERGYRVKCMAVAENNKEVAVEKLVELLSRFTPLIEESAIVESGPIVEKRQAYVVIRHVKFGPSKKGGLKKLKDINVKDIPLPPDPSTLVSEKDDGSIAEDNRKTGWYVSETGDDEASGPTDEEKPVQSSSENRYLKKEPKGQFPPERWMNNRDSADGRDAGRVDPRFRNQTPNQQFSRPGFPNQQPSRPGFPTHAPNQQPPQPGFPNRDTNQQLPRPGFPNRDTNQQLPRPGFPSHAPNQQPPRPGFSNNAPNQQPPRPGFLNNGPNQQPPRPGFPNNAPNQQPSRPGFQNQQPSGPPSPSQSPPRRGVPGNPASGYGIFSNLRSNSNRDDE